MSTCRPSTVRSLHLVLALVATLTACGSPGTATKVKGAREARSTTTEATTAALSVRDAWVQPAEAGRTAAYGVFANLTTEDLTVVAVVADASPFVELHETVTGPDGAPISQAKNGGFLIPAGSEHALQPGADELVLMALTHPVRGGDTVSFSLSLSDGTTFDFAAPVRGGGSDAVAPTTVVGAQVLGTSTVPGPSGAPTTTAPRSGPAPSTSPAVRPGPTTPATTAPTAAQPPVTQPPVTHEADSLSIRDVWVLPADAGRMSAVYGVMTNSGSGVITITSATCAVSRMELHETIPLPGGGTTMRPKAGGFRISAGAQYTLKPGGDHLMLMGVSRQIKVGETLSFTLVLADGSTYSFDAPVHP